MCRDGEDDGRARKAQVIRMGKKEGKKKTYGRQEHERHGEAREGVLVTSRNLTAVGKEGRNRPEKGEMPHDEGELLVAVVGKEEMVVVCEGLGFLAKILQMKLEKMLCMRGREREAVKEK